MELADTVRWTLVNPSAIFRGIRDLEKDIAEDDGICYVSVPKHAYNHRTGEKCPRWKGEVFLVFVSDERVVFNWYWYAADEREPRLPGDYKDRFFERVL